MNEKRKEIKPITLRFPLTVLEQMKELAKEHNRSLSGEILNAMQEYIRRNQKG